MAKEKEKKNVGEYAFEFQQLGQQIKALGHLFEFCENSCPMDHDEIDGTGILLSRLGAKIIKLSRKMDDDNSG